MRASLLTTVLLISLSTLSLTGCGGGGGDGSTDYAGAANVSLSVSPSSLDSGDRAFVRTEVSEVHPNGIALKFRYPAGLAYVAKSGAITVGEKRSTLKPIINSVTSDEGSVYLVFYLSQKLFRRSGQTYSGEPGTIEFQLVGKSAVHDGLVEVDADVDDPNVANTAEFNLAKPEFLPEDQQSITVQVAE
jgi:hypothetical protein